LAAIQGYGIGLAVVLSVMETDLAFLVSSWFEVAAAGLRHSRAPFRDAATRQHTIYGNDIGDKSRSGLDRI
jgi:hypothetical protein